MLSRLVPSDEAFVSGRALRDSPEYEIRLFHEWKAPLHSDEESLGGPADGLQPIRTGMLQS